MAAPSADEIRELESMPPWESFRKMVYTKLRSSARLALAYHTTTMCQPPKTHPGQMLMGLR